MIFITGLRLTRRRTAGKVLAKNEMAKKRIPSPSRSLHRVERPGVTSYFECQTKHLVSQNVLRLTRPIVVIIKTTASKNIAEVYSVTCLLAYQSELTVQINDVQV